MKTERWYDVCCDNCEKVGGRGMINKTHNTDCITTKSILKGAKPMNEIKPEDVMKAFEVCLKAECSGDCEEFGCPAFRSDGCYYYLRTDEYDGSAIYIEMLKDAIALITAQEQRIKKLIEENESLKQCMEHEHASFMETFGEWSDKCERLAEENERLRELNDALASGFVTVKTDIEQKMVDKVVDTARKQAFVAGDNQYISITELEEIAKGVIK